MLDQNQIKTLLSMPDESLRKIITEAALSAGIGKFKVTHALSDLSKLRSAAEKLTPEQLNILLGKAGDNITEKIKQEIIKEKQ